MPAPREIALTIEERDTDQFYWVLMEAVSSDATEAIYYVRLRSAAAPQPSYSSALALGANALRRLAGSAPGALPDTVL